MPKKDGESSPLISKEDSVHIKFTESTIITAEQQEAARHTEGHGLYDDHHDDHGEQRRSTLVDSIRASMRSIQEAAGQGTVFGTVMNILCNVMGTGILALPLAIYQASVGIGILTIFYSSALGAFAVYVLVKGSDYTSTNTLAEIFANSIYPISQRHKKVNGDDPLEEESPDIVNKRARARWFVESNIFFLNFGTIVVYGKALEEAMPAVIIGFLGAKPDSVWASGNFWLGVSALVFYVPTCARAMASLKWTSLIGAVTIFYVAFVIFIKFFDHDQDCKSPQASGVSFQGAGGVALFDLKVSVFEAITIFAVAYGFNYNVPPFYAELTVKTPKRMMQCIGISFPIITIVYIAAGVAGYSMYGYWISDPKYGGNILKMYPKHDIMAGIARLGLFPALALSYPVLAVGLRQVLHRVITMVGLSVKYGSEGIGPAQGLLDFHRDKLTGAFDEDPLKQPFWIIAVEAFFIVFLSILTAKFVPGIGLVISIVGALFGIWIMMIFPGIIGQCMWSKKRAEDEMAGREVYSHEGIATADVPKRGLLYGLSLGLTISGVACTLMGIFSIIYTRVGPQTSHDYNCPVPVPPTGSSSGDDFSDESSSTSTVSAGGQLLQAGANVVMGMVKPM